MIQGVSHMTFMVRDLDRMEVVLSTVFNARKIHDSTANTFSKCKERAFLVGEGAETIWISTIECHPKLTRSYNHVAFRINDVDYEDYLSRIQALAMQHREGRSGQARSIYFHDRDKHMFELYTGTLEDRLARYLSEPVPRG